MTQGSPSVRDLKTVAFRPQRCTGFLSLTYCSEVRRSQTAHRRRGAACPHRNPLPPFERPVDPAVFCRSLPSLWSPAVDNYYGYLRTFSQELGARIVEMYPPLQGPNDPLPTALKTLLRQPLPAQALTISGVAKHLKTARSAIIVGECGTGNTLMSVAVAHAVDHTHLPSSVRISIMIGLCLASSR